MDDRAVDRRSATEARAEEADILLEYLGLLLTVFLASISATSSCIEATDGENWTSDALASEALV